MAIVYYPQFRKTDGHSTMKHAAYLLGTTEKRLYNFLINKDVIYYIPPRIEGEPDLWCTFEEYSPSQVLRIDFCDYVTEDGEWHRFEYSVWTRKGLMFLMFFLENEGFFDIFPRKE